MKARVIKPFFDLTTGLGCVPDNTYYEGDTYEGTQVRINELAKKGFVEKPARKRAAQRKQE